MKRFHELSIVKRILLLYAAPSAMTFGLLSLIDFAPPTHTLNWFSYFSLATLILLLNSFSLAVVAVSVIICELTHRVIPFCRKKCDGHRPPLH